MWPHDHFEVVSQRGFKRGGLSLTDSLGFHSGVSWCDCHNGEVSYYLELCERAANSSVCQSVKEHQKTFLKTTRPKSYYNLIWTWFPFIIIWFFTLVEQLTLGPTMINFERPQLDDFTSLLNFKKLVEILQAYDLSLLPIYVGLVLNYYWVCSFGMPITGHIVII